MLYLHTNTVWDRRRYYQTCKLDKIRVTLSGMTIAKGIAGLRKRLGYTQPEFARTLGVTPVTVSRYENGKQPKSEVIKRLADLAEQAGALHLRDLFGAAWKGDVMTKLETLQSPGAQRRIPVFELQRWLYWQESIYQASTLILDKGAPLTMRQQRAVFKGIQELAEKTCKDLRVYQGTPESRTSDPGERTSSSEPACRLNSLKPDWITGLFEPRPAELAPYRRTPIEESEGKHEENN